jgi:DNA helicase MCM8
VKAFVKQLTNESDRRGTALFQTSDLQELAETMRLKITDFDRFLDVLNAECYILKKGPKLYQVMTSNTSSSKLRG